MNRIQKRPDIKAVPLVDVFPHKPGTVYITMSIGQWDELLQAAYDEGLVLLELDDREQVVRAYRKPQPT
ncbi:MAG TPA: hypothetical protein VG122_00280 [Gemmata sp.]|nr:hypothetical protein [Gemmata sp.]